jgi:enamine deaminase RidA (YjgF/YER057c/UK114 family)
MAWSFDTRSEALQNLEAILSRAGRRLQNIVKTTIWLRREADFGAFNESYAGLLSLN